MPAQHQLPYSRRWPLPMGDPSMKCAMRVGPDGIEPPTSSMWARRSAAELWTNDRGTGAVPQRRCALDHQALRTGWSPQLMPSAEGLGKLRRLSRFWRPALWPLSYARVAGEIGIEPMASCASDRRSTHAELLAVLMC